MHPSFNWMLAFCSEVRQRIDMYTARELATLMWICIRVQWVLSIICRKCRYQYQEVSSMHTKSTCSAPGLVYLGRGMHAKSACLTPGLVYLSHDMHTKSACFGLWACISAPSNALGCWVDPNALHVYKIVCLPGWVGWPYQKVLSCFRALRLTLTRKTSSASSIMSVDRIPRKSSLSY
eukprot:scaffold105966_cov24-Tisochrysis_lutea.AAC.2